MNNHRYLGIDLGVKKIGIAISTSGIFARPLDRILVHSQQIQDQAGLILKICCQEKITDLVIGYPLHRSNQVSKMCQLVDNFLVAIRHHPNFKTDLKIILQNEIFSTQQANDQLMMSQVKSTRANKLLDSIAACVILESYFLSQNKKERL